LDPPCGTGNSFAAAALKYVSEECMNQNSLVESAAEDASTFTEFINVHGDISKCLYLDMHPEEKD
jgi:hypothetical protein